MSLPGGGSSDRGHDDIIRMERIDLHLFLPGYQKQDRNNNACDDNTDGWFFIFSRTES